MKRSEKYKLSLYKEIAVLDKEGRVKLVFEDNTKTIYVKKIVDISAKDIYSKIMNIKSSSFPFIKEIIDCDDYYAVIEEYINGRTLHTVIEEDGLIDVSTAEKYMKQLCRAVILLHQNGIIHRDITENNVMITGDGIIKLIDFNISHKADSEKTSDTAVMGTNGYAAPEQYGFLRSDERTDIYSMGVIFNFMLTGSPELNTDIKNGRCRHIIKTCTQFDPNKRYGSCKDLLSALDFSKTVFISKDDNIFKVLFKYVCKAAFAAAVIFEGLMGISLVINIYDGGNISQDLWTFLASFILFIMPFFIIGNFLNWQKLFKMDRLPVIARAAVSVFIYLFILIIALEKIPI